MNFTVMCACGQKVYFAQEYAGTHRLCPYCDAPLVVPGRPARVENPLGLISHRPASQAATATAPAPAPAPAPAAAEPAEALVELMSPPPVPVRPAELWSWRSLIWAVALIPLVISLLAPAAKREMFQRLTATISHLSPEEQRHVDQILLAAPEKRPGLDELLNALPQHRIDGAHLSKDSWAHWLYAAISGGAFVLATILLLPSSLAKPPTLLKIGLFTGTVGIVLLIVFQIAAAVTQGVWMRGFGIVTLLFYIVKIIGYSYSAAANADSGFLLSAFGFTFGVGFCEEVCKLLPALVRVTRLPTIDWRGAYLLGLVSGFGFGVSEGITYASGYNGISTVGIYAVRFISCVALHGIWSGAAAITLYERRWAIRGTGPVELLIRLLTIVAVPMVLHGLYDTLLKKDMGSLALVTAIVSVAWMTFQIQRMRRKESGSPETQGEQRGEQALSQA